MLRVVGQYLKDKRVEAGYTQFEVAKKLGYLTAQYISNIERGIALPPNRSLTKLIGLYKIPEDQLFSLLLQAQKILLEDSIFGKRNRKARA